MALRPDLQDAVGCGNNSVCADGTKRAFFKEFVKVVSAADVIIEVLDARDPLGSRCKDVERYVRQAGTDKKIILLVNKMGTSCPREQSVALVTRATEFTVSRRSKCDCLACSLCVLLLTPSKVCSE